MTKLPLFILTALVCCSGACAWRASQLASLRAIAVSLQTDILATEQVLAETNRLGKLPPTALSPGTSDADLLRAVQDVFGEAGIPSASIRQLAIDPRTKERSGPRGVGLSKHSGRVNFIDITLPQLGRMLTTLRLRLPPVRIEQILLNKEGDSVDPPRYRVLIVFAAYVPTTATSPFSSISPTPLPPARQR